MSSRSSPVEDTGLAAPMLVPGAMTAKLAAAVIKVPADPALAPPGVTYTATGMGDSSRSSTIFRVDPSSPPGVSNSMTRSAAWGLTRFLQSTGDEPLFDGIDDSLYVHH